jgi:hypothetical protein
MIDRPRRMMIVVAILTAAALLAYAAGVAPGAIVLFGAMSALSAWRHRKEQRERAAFYHIVWELRSADRPTRERLLAELEPPKLRNAIALVIANDGTEEQEGDLERFPYPQGLKRFVSRRYWVLWGLAALLLLLSAFSSMWMPLRGISALLALLFGFLAWRASREERALESVIEVTPFRVSECFPDGMRRTLSLRGFLVLRNEPQQQRVLLAGGRDDPEIALDYRRMGFARMCELVWQYGGFENHDGVTPAS